jgi:hypothetical protein
MEKEERKKNERKKEGKKKKTRELCLVVLTSVRGVL